MRVLFLLLLALVALGAQFEALHSDVQDMLYVLETLRPGEAS